MAEKKINKISKHMIDPEYTQEIDGKIQVLSGDVTEVTHQLADTALDVKQMYTNVRAFGAKGDWDGVNGTDDSDAFISALSYANDNGITLLIPGGNYYITKSLVVMCDVECRGTIIIPNHTDTKITISGEDPLTIEGVNAFNSLKKGDVKLDIKQIPSIPSGLLSDYYYTIMSTEELIKRLGAYTGSQGYYTKNESGSVQRVSSTGVYTETPIIHTYEDLNKATLVLSKKMRRIVIRGLKVARVQKGTNISQIIVEVKRNNVDFENISIENCTTEALSVGIKLYNTHGITLKNILLSDIYGTGDTYPISNYNSYDVKINGLKYIETTNASGAVNPSKGYSARHGNYVSFKNCSVYGIDDHYGYNYFVEDCLINGEGVTFAGENLSFKKTKFIACPQALKIRPDTPDARGTLLFEDCDFISCGVIVHHQVTLDSVKVLGYNPYYFDDIVFRRVSVTKSKDFNSAVGIRGVISASTTGGTQYTININSILFDGVESDLPLVNMYASSKFKIEEITINKSKVKYIADFPVNYNAITLSSHADRKHTIGEINVIKSDNMSMALLENSIVGVVNYENSKLGVADLRNTLYKFATKLNLHLEKCVIGKATRLENSVGDGFVSFEDCFFESGRTVHALNKPENLLYTKRNLAEVGSNLSLLPQLNGYVNPSIYVTG